MHDQSASGATVFIEPMAVVNLNNDIKQLMSAEKYEVERILSMVTAQIASFAPAIYGNCEALAQLDFVFAKARLCQDMQGEMPEINNDGYVFLRQARHPLIPKDVVVPIDISIGREFNTLLITGPNTGGKTVSLKTLGLFALMTQAGLYLPVAPGSEMPVFNNIFADIGDEQSIEQSLSTFSGHMTNLVRILSQVSALDLVLIDEIGAGTDPDEGAALAMAILEFLHGVGARTIATTHYSELKAFAYSRDGIENSCVEFDVKTLRPTYRLLIGIPGSSNAFAISRRLGLDEDIIVRARQLVDKDYAEFETVLSGLEEQKRACANYSEEAARLERELVVRKQALVREQELLTNKKNAILSKAQNEAAAVLRQARREAEEIIAELKCQFAEKNGNERQTAIHNARRRLRDNLSGVTSLTSLEREEDNLPAVTAETATMLKPGMFLYVTTLQQKGSVLSVGIEEVTLQMGIMKVNVPFANCRLLQEPDKVSKSSDRSGITVSKIQDMSRQVDIRGTTVDEGEAILEKYLDDAVLSGLNEVLVIHGKGTGALRKGIREYLKNHQDVRDIRVGEANEGGDGATVVRLL